MTPEQAKEFIVEQCMPDSGNGEPQTFLGGLRPYRGLLPRAAFHGLMSALRTLAPQLASPDAVDRELILALWSPCHLTRLWALTEDGMLRRNNLIGAADLETLERRHAMFSYAVMVLLESGNERGAFSEYDLYRAESSV
jgi:hypothetical protein